MSGHPDLGIFNKFGASSIFTWEKADTASAACPAQPGSLCEGEGDVVAVVAPLGGVAQVIFPGVQVVEVGVEVRVHEDRGKEEDGEVQVEVKGEVEENQRQPHMYMA